MLLYFDITMGEKLISVLDTDINADQFDEFDYSLFSLYINTTE